MEIKIEDLFGNLRNDGFDLHSALRDVEKELADAKNKKDVESANKLWAVHTVVDIHIGMIDVFNLLKSNEYYKSWCEAEQIKIKCINLKRNFPGVYPIVEDLYKCVIRLQSLYPYRIFSSYVIKINRESCSICGKARSLRADCGHRKGYVYNGELCCNIVEQWEFKGIDIVENPVHKYAVLFPVDKDGNQVDNYDYSLLSGLMQYWKSPFQHWIFKVKHTHKPVSDFPDINDDCLCPCGSGKKYCECCKSDSEGVKHRIYTFMMEKIQ